MTQIGTFIREARDKKLGDDAIREALVAQGWDKSVIDMELSGLQVPKPDRESQPARSHEQQPSLSPLMAALHHVLLWFFTGSSTVTITAVVASLFGTHVSSQALTSMIAVTAVTFTPYAAMFIVYLLKLRRTPGLVPGKVWSIITVCLHSVAAMVAGIILIVSLINGGSTGSTVSTSAALIITLDAIVIFTYSSVGFSKQSSKLRKIATWLHLPLLILLFGTLTILSVAKLGPAKYDAQLRQDLTAAVQTISNYARSHNALPESSADASIPQSVEYHKTNPATYEVCGTFKTSASANSYYSSYSTPSDSYVSEYQFQSAAGHRCFTFQSDSLRQNLQHGL